MPENPNRAEISRRVEKAEKLLQKGKTPEALAEYLQILEEDRQNDNVRQIAGDLCLSLNKVPQAVQLLGELFERQIEASDATRASLTYKKLARYANPTWEQKVRFGQLLERPNRKLAVGTYENALEDLRRQGRREEALLVLRRIVSLEPSPANHLRFAELSSELGEHAMAGDAYLQLAEVNEISGENGSTYFERAYAENPADAKIAFAYGRNLLLRGDAGAAIFIFEPLVQAESASVEMRDLYAQALLVAERCVEAEPLVWQMFERNPARIHQVLHLIGKMIDFELDSGAVALARKLEAFQRRRGERRSFIVTMQELMAAHRPMAEMLEFLAELFNASNREGDYAQTLLKLFDLYCAKQDYQKAADCLDRAAEVDPYEPGHQNRLVALRGKIGEQRFKTIAARVSTVKKEEHAPVQTAEPLLGAAALQDLMLQAEILVQYGMRAKAMERLQRIHQLFPQEEKRNPDLQRLYIASGFEPRYPDARVTPGTESGDSTSPDAFSTGSSPADLSLSGASLPSPLSPDGALPDTSSPGSSLPATFWHDTSFEIPASQLAVPQPAASPAPTSQFPALAFASLPSEPTTESSDVSSLAKVAEITRKLYHQGNAEGVLKTAASEIGGIWQTARCIAALRKPGLPASSVQEHHREGLLPVSAVALASLVEALQDLAVTRGAMTISNAGRAPELIEVRAAVEELQIESLLAVPLAEGDDHVGVLILTQNTNRTWQASEVLVIRTLSDQVVIALNNAGLRRLVKNLSVTDEKSGLLKRASYLDLLQAETRRGLQQGTAVTVLLMQFGRRSSVVKEYGEAAVTKMIDQIGQLFSANIRANDLAFRYEATTVALVLGDTGEKEALLAVEKLRRLLREVRWPGQEQTVEFSAALAQAVMREQYDPVDIVTEVVNRADHALELAIAQGPGKVVCQAPQTASAAVA